MLAIVVALLAAFAGVVLVGPVYIGLLQRLGYGKQIRVEGPEGHIAKAGTPTMGGMLIVVVVMFLAMAMRIEDVSTLTPMLTLVGVGILGAIDDYVNVQTGLGIRGRRKLVWQTVVALLAAWYLQRHFHITQISVPLVGDVGILPIAFILFVAFVIVAMSNGVNLTDGLDGLVTVGERARLIAEGARAAGLARVASAADLHQAEAIVDRVLDPGVGDLLLVKGSRGVELDRLVATLTGVSKADRETG